MKKIDKNFFTYTLWLLIIAVIFIVIGGISFSRTVNDPDNRFKESVNQHMHENVESETEVLRAKLSEIKTIVENSNADKETKEKVNAVIERK